MLELNVQAPFPRVDRDIETSLFRIIQEAAGNIYRHSGADHATVQLSYDRKEGIKMNIRDNGKGFSTGPGGKLPQHRTLFALEFSEFF